MMRRSAAFASISALALLVTATAQAGYDHKAALEVSQRALGRTIGDYTLRDIHGQPFPLESLAGKPFIVSLIYTSCHHVCPLITQNIAKTVPIAREALGNDSFGVITVGFEWAVDTPDRMRMYAAERGVDFDNWHFLSGDPQTIQALSDDLGFQYFPSAKGFDHLMQTTVVDGAGRVYRQVYGQDFEAPALVEPLKELVFDTPREAGFVEHWIDTFKLFCTVWDPNTGRYRFDYSIFMTVLAGIMSLGAVFVFIVHEWRHAR